MVPDNADMDRRDHLSTQADVSQGAGRRLPPHQRGALQLLLHTQMVGLWVWGLRVWASRNLLMILPDWWRHNLESEARRHASSASDSCAQALPQGGNAWQATPRAC